MSSTVRNEKLSSGHSQDFPLQRNLLLLLTSRSINFEHGRVEGAQIQKVGHYFLDAVLHVAPTCKYHPPTKALAVSVYDMTKASQIK